MPLPKFIKIGETYHSTSMIRNISEEKTNESRCIIVSIHGKLNKYGETLFFNKQTVCDGDISKSLNHFVKEKEDSY